MYERILTSNLQSPSTGLPGYIRFQSFFDPFFVMRFVRQFLGVVNKYLSSSGSSTLSEDGEYNKVTVYFTVYKYSSAKLVSLR